MWSWKISIRGINNNIINNKLSGCLGGETRCSECAWVSRWHSPPLVCCWQAEVNKKSSHDSLLDKRHNSGQCTNVFRQTGVLSFTKQRCHYFNNKTDDTMLSNMELYAHSPLFSKSCSMYFSPHSEPAACDGDGEESALGFFHSKGGEWLQYWLVIGQSWYRPHPWVVFQTRAIFKRCVQSV